MKRSEAIKKLQWWTVRHDEAERLLTFIEKDLGMLPPLALINNSPYPKEHKFYGPNKTLENTWEPEHEKDQD